MDKIDFEKMVKGMLNNIDSDLEILRSKIEHLNEIREKVSALSDFVSKNIEKE